MTTLLRAFWAETLKMKRTLSMRLAFIAPAAVMIYCSALVPGRRSQNPTTTCGSSIWRMGRIFWTLLMLPLFVTLQSALLGGIEHRNEQWKQMFAQPVSRWAIYMAKQLGVALMMALSFVALMGFLVASGLLLRLVRPDLGLHVAIPWGDLVWPLGAAYLASWLLMAIHTWVGLRWKSFALASAVGIVMTVAGVVIISSKWGSYYPWAMPGVLVNGFSKGMSLWRPELVFRLRGGHCGGHRRLLGNDATRRLVARSGDDEALASPSPRCNHVRYFISPRFSRACLLQCYFSLPLVVPDIFVYATCARVERELAGTVS